MSVVARTKPERYVGLNHEINGGMTPIAKIIRDAKVFGLIDDTETCEGWNLQGLDALLDEVNRHWDQYGCLVSNLPNALRERHRAIHGKAFQQATQAGWSGELETDDEQ
ncbi:MAG: hypothetical protein HWE20_10265 [Gammaproteobacteria bacterium]|nr:hypothetical protein [Gammaproteobacteria bacterium]